MNEAQLGYPALEQTASAETAKEAADTAQSMLVTLWNVGIAGGGLVSGLLLGNLGVGVFPWIVGVYFLCGGQSPGRWFSRSRMRPMHN
ncbi:hypothetical protein ACIP86_13950 [Pseudomonas neuropathica]